MIRAPAAHDVIELCDWAELSAATTGRATSVGDIVKVIQPDDSIVDAIGSDDNESMRDESIASEVIAMAQRRSRLLEGAYPFRVSSDLIGHQHSSRGDAYMFFLLFAALESSLLTPTARHLFEVECLECLRMFIGGESYHFGWTDQNAAKGKIQTRITEFCSTTNLGWKPANPVRIAPENNEVGVDLLIWKGLQDERANTLVFVGQCASGHNWRSKLQTSAALLLEDCLSETRDGPWVNCFCTPFQIPDRIWRESARSHDGVLFDRLRLILGRRQSPRRFGSLHDSESVEWLNAQMAAMRSAGGAVPRTAPKRSSAQARKKAGRARMTTKKVRSKRPR